MKLTAIIPDEIINKVIELSGGKNITESVKIALLEYIRMSAINELTKTIKENPIHFVMTAKEIRNLSNS